MALRHNRRKRAGSGGFTLLETAISLVILGLILAAIAPLYKQYVRDRSEKQTQENLEIARQAIEDFKSEHGRYPCPAALNLGRADPNYGHETDCTVATVAPGACEPTGAYCVQRSQRAILTVPQRRVRIGALPFREILMPETKTIDGWDSKIIYAVTESTTRVADYNDNRGGIRLVDENGQVVGNPAFQDSYKFLILSVGDNRVGGYTIDGRLTGACGVGYAAADRENCDFLAGQLNATFAVSNQSSANTNNFFDDKVAYTAADVTGNSEGWRWGQADLLENPSDIIIQDRNVRIGNFDPPTERLSVFGNMRLDDGTNGRVAVNQFCNTGNTACFDVALLSHTCPVGEYIIGIKSSATAGAPHIQCGPIWFGCPDSGEILAGRNVDGSPLCVPTTLPPTVLPTPPPSPTPPDPVPCVPETATDDALCPSPPSAPGTYYQIYRSRDCTSGNWINTGNNYSSVCCSLTQTPSYDCGTYATPRYFPWTQTRGTCTGAWVPPAPIPLPTCNCPADTIAYVEPPCAANQVGDQCTRVVRSYPLSGGRCWGYTDAVDLAGTCKAAIFRWKGQSYTGTNNVNNIPAIPDDGDTCNFGDAPRTCERVTGSTVQVWNCACLKEPDPCDNP